MAIITISRGTFSGGQKLAECVAEKLGYRCISRQVLVDAARNYGVPMDKLSQALMEPPGFLERLTTQRVHYLAYIRAALCREVKYDNLVYHGHAGHLLLIGLPNVLKIRVIASMEFRIKGAMERRQLGRDQAIEFIKKIDEQRARWTKFLYHVDWTDPSLYDIIINLNRISISSACEIVSHAADLEEFKTTPQSQKAMEDLLLSTEVRAAIASSGASKGISDAGIEIESDEGIVTIGGTVGSIEDADKIREIARAVPGVKDLKSKMQIQHYW